MLGNPLFFHSREMPQLCPSDSAAFPEGFLPDSVVIPKEDTSDSMTCPQLSLLDFMDSFQPANSIYVFPADASVFLEHHARGRGVTHNWFLQCVQFIGYAMWHVCKHATILVPVNLCAHQQQQVRYKQYLL